LIDRAVFFTWIQVKKRVAKYFGAAFWAYNEAKIKNFHRLHDGRKSILEKTHGIPSLFENKKYANPDKVIPRPIYFFLKNLERIFLFSWSHQI
jgi:hypothetical protein